MMDKSELLKAISNTLVKTKVEKLAAISSENSYSVSDLLELTFYPKPELAFRAAWILEHIQQYYSDRFMPFTVDFLDKYPEQKNKSCQRHFTKIMMLLTGQEQSGKQRIPEGYNLEPVVEKTFEWLIDRTTPVAVQVNCLDILFNLKHKFPWIEEELKAEVAFYLHDGSAAMQSRGKAILKKLNR